MSEFQPIFSSSQKDKHFDQNLQICKRSQHFLFHNHPHHQSYRLMVLKDVSYTNQNDPYITDSVGWGYYLIGDYQIAEKYLLHLPLRKLRKPCGVILAVLSEPANASQVD